MNVHISFISLDKKVICKHAFLHMQACKHTIIIYYRFDLYGLVISTKLLILIIFVCIQEADHEGLLSVVCIENCSAKKKMFFGIVLA